MVNPAEIQTRSDLTGAVAGLFRQAGKSYLALSSDVGISVSTLHAIVNGGSFPRWRTLERILRACGVSDLAEWRGAHTRVSRAGPRPAGAVRVAEARPLLLGVQRPVQVPDAGSESVPAYVLRDLDQDTRGGIRAAVAAASRHGGFILLVGDSSVGKTRCLYEAVHEILPDWWLVHPSTAAEARGLAGRPADRMLIWLDDLQRYLDGKEGLTAEAVRPLLQQGGKTVLAGTLTAGRYGMYALLDDAGGTFRHERDLLKLARILHLDSALTAAEHDRACELAPADSRIRAALQVKEYGFTQTLAGAPQQVDHWRGADPYAKALLAAAVDAARLGAQGALSTELLRSAVPGYCTNAERAVAPDDWFGRSLAYATARLPGSVCALIPQAGSDTDMGQVAGYTAAEYLQHHVGRARRSEIAPASLWLSFRKFLTSPRDLRAVTFSAFHRWLFTEAEYLERRHSAITGEPLDGVIMPLMVLQRRHDELRALADSGNMEALITLTVFVDDESDEEPSDEVPSDEEPDEAPDEEQDPAGNQEEGADEARFRQKIMRLQTQHENALRARADACDWRARRELAGILKRQGREGELEARADTGDLCAADALADLLARQGREQELRGRIGAGDFAAGHGLITLLRLQNRKADADRMSRYGLLSDGSIATGPPRHGVQESR